MNQLHLFKMKISEMLNNHLFKGNSNYHDE